MKSSKTKAGGSDGIFGKDDTHIEARQSGAYFRTFKRIYEIKWTTTTTDADMANINSTLPDNLKRSGESTMKWMVIPLDNTLIYMIIPWITTTTQNLTNVGTIPNSYFYYVVDYPRILPGYNQESSLYSIGKSDLIGSASLQPWKIAAEPQVQYANYTTTDT